MRAADRNFQDGARQFRRFLFASAGNISITVSLSVPAFMGAAGLASDFAQFTNKQTELQAAADSAALAAAKELAIATSNDTAIISSAEAYSSAAVTSDISTIVDIDRANASVSVEVREEWKPFFAHYLGAEISPVIARATATLAGGQSSICVLALAETAAKSIELKRNSVLKAPDCGVYSNSSASNSIAATTASVIDAGLVCTVGGVASSGATVSPAPVTDCPKTEDPLATRRAPSFGSCDYTSTSIDAGSATISPGTYCGGISVSSNASVNFMPGTYIILNGPFTVGGNASVSGTHVGFHLVGDTSVINFSSNTSVDFSGPSTGSMAGLLFFEDRHAPAGRVHKINSSKAHTMTGTIYLSRGTLRINPKAMVAQNSAYTAIIVDTLQVFGGPELVLNSNYSATDVPVPAGIRSSIEVVLSE